MPAQVQVHAAAAPADPTRLDPRVRPVTQALELKVDPTADRYEGRARVELRFEVATNRFRFHAKGLELGRATLDGKELAVAPGQADLVAATAAKEITAGTHVFEIEFGNEFNRDGTGLYKAESEGKAYLFTQMEAQYARQAFPCWDEPRFKIPWRMTVTIPAAMDAVSNMPVAQASTNDFGRTLEFGRTPPMSSYLVALAVGPLEFRPIAGQAVPGRVVTTQSQSGLGELAAKEAGPLLGALEDYFGIPYPYPKLDHIAAPEFVFGAMENVGAIVYKDSLLLQDAGHVSFGARRTLTEVVAHEMAHMWFGNLVTMEWWDDVWLNESFATWISYKVGERVHPEDRFHLLAFQDVSRARAEDAQPSVRPIRRPFRGDDNIMEAVDVLSYQKGHAILRMLEGWVGEETFRARLRQYFHRHQWANARAEDLWAAMEGAGGGSAQEMMRRYIEQPGVPALTLTRLSGNRCEVRQERYRTVIGEKTTDQTWHVPVRLRYGVGSAVKEYRALLTSPSQEFEVPELDRADWLYPNAGESGYYAWSLSPDLSKALAGRGPAVLTDIERLGLLNMANLAVQAGKLPADEALKLLLAFANDPVPEIKMMVVNGLRGAQRLYADPSDDPAFAALVRSTLRPVLDVIGFEPKAGEPPETGPLRSQLLRVLGHGGEDPDVIAFCRERAQRQLSAPRSVEPGIAQVVLGVASWHGDAAWSEQLRTAFERAKAPAVRRRFLSALTLFKDPALVRSGLEYLLTDAVRPTELLSNVRAARDEDVARAYFDWVVERYDRLKQRLPEDQLPFLTSVVAGGDSALLERAQAFFLDASRVTPLTRREFEKVAERVRLRAVLRERNQAAVKQFVADYGRR